MEIRGHFGSRAFSVQVNIVAVSDHVFHKFPFDLLIQVSANQLSLFLCIPFVLMATCRASEDALHTSLPGSPPLSSNVGSCNGSGHDLDRMASRSTDGGDSRVALTLRSPCAECGEFRKKKKIQTITNSVVNLTSRVTNIEQIVNTFSTTMALFAEMEQNYSSLTARLCKVEGDIVSASSVSGSARSWHVLGPMTSPKPQGPMARGHLITTETHDEGLILLQAQKMNNHEVPSYFESLSNNTSKELHSGSIPFGKSLPLCLFSLVLFASAHS